MWIFAGALVLGLAALLTSPAHAQDQEPLPLELEARAQALYDDIRCPQCAGQTIGQSAASIAKAMRETVRERLRAGEDDEQIIAFMVASFGQEVLASPPKRGLALLVWLGPPIGLVLGAAGVALAVRRMRRGAGQGAVPALVQAESKAAGDLAPYLDMVDREIGGGGRGPSR